MFMKKRTEMFIITGMHCAACVARIEKMVKNIPGVSDAKVNLLTEKAKVEWDIEQDIQPKDIVEVVDKLGFQAYWEQAPIKKTKVKSDLAKVSIAPIINEPVAKYSEFIITGMHCAACVSNIEKAVKEINGIEDVKVNLLTEKARVTWAPGIKINNKIVEEKIANIGFNAYLEDSIDSVENELDKKEDGVLTKSSDNSLDFEDVSKPMALDEFYEDCADKQYNNDDIDDEDLEIIDGGTINKRFKGVPLTKNHPLIKDGFPTDRPLGPFAFRRNAKAPLVNKSQKERRKHQSEETFIKVATASFLLIPLAFGAWLGPIFGWAPLPNWIKLAFATIAIVSPGSILFVAGYKALRSKSLTMDVLVTMGILTAYFVSIINMLFGRTETYFETVVWLITFILIGRMLELNAKGKTSEAIEKLASLQAKEANIIVDGIETKVTLDQVKIGDELIVRPFEIVPVDGIILEGQSSINEAMVTGESLPVDKTVGAEVIGSTENTSGTFKMQARRVGKDTLLSKIVKTVEDAQASKAPIQRIADLVAGYFVMGVLIIAALTTIGWILIGGKPIEVALIHASAVLMIACPCALGLATPTSIMVGSGLGAEHGILIKDATTLEESGNVNTIIFDKTGTITKGELSVGLSEIADSFDVNEIMNIARSVEEKTNHPVGRAIADYAAEQGGTVIEVEGFSEVPGKGVIGVVNGQDVMVGRREWLEELGISLEPLAKGLAKTQSVGMTLVVMAVANEAAGLWGVNDTIRPEAKEVIAQLQEKGIELWMVTGDNQATAEKIAAEVGVKHVLAHVLPEDKLAKIQELKDQGKIVGMIGDGINDAPALAKADVSWAIGNGTEVAIESAQIVLVNGSLEGLVSSINLSRKTLVNIKQNLFWAFIFNSIGIPLAAIGILSPAFAGTAMALSSVTVVSNALRLKRAKI